MPTSEKDMKMMSAMAPPGSPSSSSPSELGLDWMFKTADDIGAPPLDSSEISCTQRGYSPNPVPAHQLNTRSSLARYVTSVNGLGYMYKNENESR